MKKTKEYLEDYVKLLEEQRLSLAKRVAALENEKDPAIRWSVCPACRMPSQVDVAFSEDDWPRCSYCGTN